MATCRHCDFQTTSTISYKPEMTRHIANHHADLVWHPLGEVAELYNVADYKVLLKA
jgi:hypothetical protein